jgi:hypothetical protein
VDAKRIFTGVWCEDLGVAKVQLGNGKTLVVHPGQAHIVIGE